MAVVDGYGNSRAVACHVGCNNSLLACFRFNGQFTVGKGYVIVVKGYPVKVIFGNGQSNGAAVCLAVICTVYDRGGCIKYNAVRAQIGRIARHIGDLCIDNKLCVGFDEEGTFILGEGLIGKLFNGKVFGGQKIFDSINAAVGVACFDRHRLIVFVEQVEGNSV